MPGFGRQTSLSRGILRVIVIFMIVAMYFLAKYTATHRSAKALYYTVWCAAITDHPEELRVALEQGGDPNARNPANEPALMVAAHNGNLTCCRLLLEHHANPNIRGSSDATPLEHAITTRQTAIISLLLKFHADPNQADVYGETPLMDAAAKGDPRSTRLLLDDGADPNLVSKTGVTALQIARKYRATDVEAILLQHSAR